MKQASYPEKFSNVSRNNKYNTSRVEARKNLQVEYYLLLYDGTVKNILENLRVDAVSLLTIHSRKTQEFYKYNVARNSLHEIRTK